MAPDEKSVKSAEERFAQQARMLNSQANSKIAKARAAMTQDDARWLLEFGADEVRTAIAQMMAEIQGLGLDSGVLSKVMGDLQAIEGRLTTELRNTQPREFDALQAEEGFGQFPIEKLEKHYKGLSMAISANVAARIQLAHVAVSLGLPDHAVHFMQKAYADIRWVLDGIVKDLNGREPTGKLKDILDHLKFMKEKVLVTMRHALSSHGGPELSMEEVEALMARDSDFEQTDPVAQKIYTDFSLIKNKEDLRRHTFTAVEKIAKKLPMILMDVAMILQNVQQDPGAGMGTALTQINRALTKLELAKGLMRILLVGENSFKAQLVGQMNTGELQKTIQELEQRSETVFAELEARSFARGRNPNLPQQPTLEQVLMATRQVTDNRPLDPSLRPQEERRVGGSPGENGPQRPEADGLRFPVLLPGAGPITGVNGTAAMSPLLRGVTAVG